MPERTRNPYAHPTSKGDGSAPDPSGQFRLGGVGVYAVPDIPETTDPNYTDGYSPELAVGGSADGTKLPSDIRVGKRNPPPNDPNNPEYTALRTSEYLGRLSVQRWAPTWQRARQERPTTPVIPDQVDAKEPTRPTARMMPTESLMTRPWFRPLPAAEALGPNATLHFSMADHRRLYPINLQQPRGGISPSIFRKETVPLDLQYHVAEQPQPSTNQGLFGSRRFGL